MSDALKPIGLGLMCKPPRPGLSKTRLAASVGFDVAAQLSAAFTQDCATAARQASELAPIDRVAFYRPQDAAAEIAALLGPDWPLHYADAGDLGATMDEVLSGLLARCPTGAMVMGADVPLIDPRVIAEAACTLRQGSEARVVIAPSLDGGYCLIGIRSRALAAPLFEPMAWSTSQVLAETLSRAQRAGLDVITLATQRDIDTADDLAWLRAAVAAVPCRGRATQQVLARLT